MGQISQYTALMWKNWLFAKRRWKMTIGQLLSPFLFIGLLLVIDLLPKNAMDNPFNPFPQILHQKTTEIGNVEKCRQWNDLPCKTIRYSLEDLQRQADQLPTLQKLMAYVIQEVGLPPHEFEFLPSEQDIIDHIEKQPNTTTNALVFHSIASTLYNYTLYHNATYDLLTMITPGRKPDNRNELHIAVDRAIMKFHAGEMGHETEIDVKFHSRLFPQLGYKGGQKAIDDKGSVFFYCGVMIQSIILLYNICQEKDLKLRQGLKVVGLKDGAYWMSIFTFGVILSVLSIFVLIATGYGFEIKFFTDVNFGATFVIYLTFSLAAVALAMFSSVFVEKAKASLNAGMLHFILGLLLVSIMSKSQTKEALNDPATVWPWVPQLLSLLFPAYNLGEALCEIDFYINTNKTVFTWDMLYVRRNKSRPFTFDNGTIGFDMIPLPSANDALLKLLMNFFVFGFLALYLDQVLRGSHGEPKKPYFFLTRSYWFPQSYRHIAQPPSKDVNQTSPLISFDCLTPHNEMLEVRNLKKCFTTKSWNGSKLSVNRAVDGVTLYGEENQVLAVLGHNGAGKSTMINIITGLIGADGGDAFVNGFSVTHQLEEVRKILGVCPQHDILWNELSASEHMRLLAKLKGVPKAQMDMMCKSLLSDVDLLSVAHRPVGTFSGGMKRRLSVAMSFVGNPKLVILDEPTSGMDPYVRRDIWNLILRMRKGRAILMTTHSMEEADILGDNIVIMAAGAVETEGTNIELKNKFAGYRLTISAKKSNRNGIITLVEAFIEGMSVVTEKEFGQDVDLTIALPPHCDEQMVCLLEEIEKRYREGSGLLESFSISQTSLEDVFLRVTESGAHEAE